LIAGPTASGKSALALDLAEASGAVVVNADSMQVYAVLDLLTARPRPEDTARAEHRLYGFIPPAERCSVGRWVAEVLVLLNDPALVDRDIVFVGGTGLFFDALENGMADVPEIPKAALAEAEALVKPLDRQGRLALIKARDPDMAARLAEPDPQRLVRALSVLFATGHSLAHWQDRALPPPLRGFDLERIVLDPGREIVNARIAARFDAMLERGAVDEVAALMRLGLDPDLPAMKAIGVREIATWQAGKLSRAQAVERTVVATRQYAKRQRTWFRQRMRAWKWLAGPGSDVDLIRPSS